MTITIKGKVTFLINNVLFLVLFIFMFSRRSIKKTVKVQTSGNSNHSVLVAQEERPFRDVYIFILEKLNKVNPLEQKIQVGFTAKVK